MRSFGLFGFWLERMCVCIYIRSSLFHRYVVEIKIRRNSVDEHYYLSPLYYYYALCTGICKMLFFCESNLSSFRCGSDGVLERGLKWYSNRKCFKEKTFLFYYIDVVERREVTGSKHEAWCFSLHEESFCMKIFFKIRILLVLWQEYQLKFFLTKVLRMIFFVFFFFIFLRIFFYIIYDTEILRAFFCKSTP